jgi:hypothetical protein
MSENPPGGIPSVPELKARLHAIAQRLRQPGPVDPEAQRALAELVDELSASLGSADVPPAEVAHLAESTAHLAESLHHRHNPGLVGNARDRLEQAALNAEARAPLAVGLARRLLDALANIGI